MAPHGRKCPTFFLALAAACALFCLFATTASQQGANPRRITSTAEHATNLNPALSGDGRTIVFESTAPIAGGDASPQFRTFAANVSADTTTFQRLSASRSSGAAVSRDGSRVAFSSAEDLTGANADRNSEIFLAENGALRQLTDTSAAEPGARLRDGNFQPSISDDGRLIAFASNRDLTGANGDGNTEIFLFDTANNTFTQITNTADPAHSIDAKLSGDGSRVAFVTERPVPANGGESAPRRDLILYERETKVARVVFEGGASLALTPGPAISDDGRRVVFSAEDSRGASQVFIFDGRNDVVRQLTRLGTRQADVPLNPSISGDGSRVAVAPRRSVTGGNPDASAELYLYDFPTNQPPRLTDAPREATAEVVSSLDDEGSAVAFNFSRALTGSLASPEFADTSEIFLARPSARAPFSTDLRIIHAAAHGREPALEKVLAPGQVAIARGSNLSLVARQTTRLPGGDFPRAGAGVTASVNGRPARIFYVSSTQLNFQIPDETETGLAEVAVRNHDGYESRTAVMIAASAPGLFTERGDGTGAAVALDALTQLRAPFDPADVANNARTFILFATGAARAGTLSVSLDGRDSPVVNIVRSEELPGLDEIHVRLRHSLAGAGTVRSVLTADGRASNPATVQFVGARRPARITLTPESASLGVGRSLKLVAKVFDAEGGEIAGAAVSFASSDNTVAAVDVNGAARGTGAGTATITAMVTTAAGELSAASQLRIQPLTLVVNEVLADPPDGPAGDANRDGVRSASQDEFVEIVNAPAGDIDLGSYRIESRNAAGADVARHVFAPGTILAPGTAVVVFGGSEAAGFDPLDASFGGSLVLNASTGGLSLLNGGGTLTLRSPMGEVVEQLTYGGDSPLEGDRNQSLARTADVTGDFAPHQTATATAARAFSPGTKLDGAPSVTDAPVARVEIVPPAATAQVGERLQFAARAYDAAGRELAGVIFRWESRSAAAASVDQQGLVTARAAGATEIVATTRGVSSLPAPMTVTPLPRRVARVEVTTGATRINRGGTQHFNALAFDGEGRVVAGATFSWATSDANIATIGADGLARCVGAGVVTITAATPDGAGGTASASSNIEVRVPLVLNELLADVPPDNPATAAVEGGANREGLRNSGDDEFIELLNGSDAPIDLSGLRLWDASGSRFTFPAGASLAAGRAAVVFGGGSPPANDSALGGSLVFQASSLSLNDGGDTISLRLQVGTGEFVVFTQSYGTAGGPAAASDQSLTQSPDASSNTAGAVSANTAGGNFVAHLSAPNSAGRRFSPGTRADGTPFGSGPVTRIEIAPAEATIHQGAAQTFTARAFSGTGGAEVEIPNTSFIWDTHDATTSLAPSTGRQTTLTAHGAGQFKVRARAGGSESAATLTVKPPPPVLMRVELMPESASLAAGQSRQLTARSFDQYGAPYPVRTFVFTASEPAVAAIESQTFAAGAAEATATVAARREGASQINATAGDGQRSVTSAPATITVEPPPPVPSAGQVIINEALVSFASPTTQAHADFVELYNTTDRALDISGLVVSFRAVGSGNNVRAVTLPGAVGGGTLRIGPRSYFLITNGAQTFGAAIQTRDGHPDGFDASLAAVEINPATVAATPLTCNAPPGCFDINNTTGAIRIDIGNVKLDGLAYKGGGDPAPPFLAFGEGTLFAFTSGTTNDLIRSPNAADTGNNSADFKRNGAAASVTPKDSNAVVP